jgi:hypothetical protein
MNLRTGERESFWNIGNLSEKNTKELQNINTILLQPASHLQ